MQRCSDATHCAGDEHRQKVSGLGCRPYTCSTAEARAEPSGAVARNALSVEAGTQMHTCSLQLMKCPKPLLGCVAQGCLRARPARLHPDVVLTAHVQEVVSLQQLVREPGGADLSPRWCNWLPVAQWQDMA